MQRPRSHPDESRHYGEADEASNAHPKQHGTDAKKGEERHGLSRWVFFGNQGEFDTGDYVEIMNKASCLSLVSNAILYWNTVKISDIVDRARQQGETINDDLAHISPLRFRHVRAHGTYFVDEK